MDFKISFLFSWQMWTVNLETKIKLQHLWFYIVKFDSRPGKHGIRHQVKYGIYCIFAISPQKINLRFFLSVIYRNCIGELNCYRSKDSQVWILQLCCCHQQQPEAAPEHSPGRARAPLRPVWPNIPTENTPGAAHQVQTWGQV